MDARFVEHARLRGWSAPALREAEPMRLGGRPGRRRGDRRGE
ncbi:hypothetical protein ABTZ58_35290 [Streptomyces sp. NPDC094143]